MTDTVESVLDARQKRAEHLHDLIYEAREIVRKRLNPHSPQDRDLYEKLNAALYALRGDPFDMHIRAALAIGTGIGTGSQSVEQRRFRVEKQIP